MGAERGRRPSSLLTLWLTHMMPALCISASRTGSEKFFQAAQRFKNVYPVCFTVVCDRVADILLLMDSSGSIGSTDFDMERSFMADLVRQFGAAVSPNGLRIGLATFGATSETIFFLDEFDNSQSVIDRILTFNRRTFGSTNILGAFETVRNQLLAPGRGNRDNAPDIVIIITDGFQVQYPPFRPFNARPRTCTISPISQPHSSFETFARVELALQLQVEGNPPDHVLLLSRTSPETMRRHFRIRSCSQEQQVSSWLTSDNSCSSPCSPSASDLTWRKESSS